MPAMTREYQCDEAYVLQQDRLDGGSQRVVLMRGPAAAIKDDFGGGCKLTIGPGEFPLLVVGATYRITIERTS